METLIKHLIKKYQKKLKAMEAGAEADTYAMVINDLKGALYTCRPSATLGLKKRKA